MTISSSTRTWVESLDPTDIDPFDRGRLRALLDGPNRNEVLELLGSTGEASTGSDAFDRGFESGRASGSPRTRSIDPHTT